MRFIKNFKYLGRKSGEFVPLKLLHPGRCLCLLPHVPPCPTCPLPPPPSVRAWFSDTLSRDEKARHFHDKFITLLQDVLWKNYRFPEDGEKRTFKLKSVVLAVRFSVGLFRAKISRRHPVHIFYATETGVSKRYAEKLKKIFAQFFNVSVLTMDQ